MSKLVPLIFFFGLQVVTLATLPLVAWIGVTIVTGLWSIYLYLDDIRRFYINIRYPRHKKNNYFPRYFIGSKEDYDVLSREEKAKYDVYPE